jgi:hypothetical protein
MGHMLCCLVGVVTACTFTVVISIVHCIMKVKVISLDIKFAPFCLPILHLIPLLIFHFNIPVTYLLNFRIHSKDITNVTFHRKYPLFASSSEDCTAYVCHGMVYSDLNQNPLIVPLEILRGHSSSDGRGMHVIGPIFFSLFF